MPESLLFPNRDYERVSLQLEERCQQQAQEIIQRIAGRIVRAITKHNAAYVQDDFARVGLNFLDQLSLMTARGWALENISFGLEQFRDELITKEIKALSQFVRMEKMPVRFTDIRPGFVATALLSSEKKYPMLIKPEKAAKYIVRGLHCGRRVVTFDWRYRALVFFWRLIPRPLWERLTWVNN